MERDERTYAFASNLTKLKGAHEFRFGYSVNKLRMDHWQPELGYGPRGFMQTARRTPPRSTAAARIGQHLQRLRRVPDGPAWTWRPTSVQNELMTTREWQHNIVRARPLAGE